tara:strand:+ start:6570 stop:7100 length:531 start_codon:yes stop_codon:yes gene_type:complete
MDAISIDDMNLESGKLARFIVSIPRSLSISRSQAIDIAKAIILPALMRICRTELDSELSCGVQINSEEHGAVLWVSDEALASISRVTIPSNEMSKESPANDERDQHLTAILESAARAEYAIILNTIHKWESLMLEAAAANSNSIPINSYKPHTASLVIHTKNEETMHHYLDSDEWA